MSTSEELVSVLRERFYQSEEKVDFQKTFMNFARDQNCREAKMTVMNLRQVLGAYMDIRPNDSKFKLIPEVISLLGFTDRNMKIECQQVIDQVLGKFSSGGDEGSLGYGGGTGTSVPPVQPRCSCGDRTRRSSNGNRPPVSYKECYTRRESFRSAGSIVMSRPSGSLVEASSHHASGGRIPSLVRGSNGSIAEKKTYSVIDSSVPSVGGATTSKSSKGGNAVENLERQYRMSVIELQVAEYDNKLYKKTLEQLYKQLEYEKKLQQNLKSRFEARKRKFRNVKQKFRLQSEVVLREIVSLTSKCNNMLKAHGIESCDVSNVSRRAIDSRAQSFDKFNARGRHSFHLEKDHRWVREENRAGMGDSFVTPTKVPLVDKLHLSD